MAGVKGWTASGVLLLALVAGCSEDPPKKGVITSNEFNAAHEESYMYCGGWSTTTVNGVTTSSCMVWLIGYNHIPDQWRVRVTDDSDPKHVKKGWISVSQDMFNKCPIDQLWPDCWRRPQ